MSENKEKKRVLSGNIVKIIDSKTVKVRVNNKYAHPIYGKTVHSSKKYLVNVPANLLVELDAIVVISSTRPISKRKCWEIISLGEKNK